MKDFVEEQSVSDLTLLASKCWDYLRQTMTVGELENVAEMFDSSGLISEVIDVLKYNGNDGQLIGSVVGCSCVCIYTLTTKFNYTKEQAFELIKNKEIFKKTKALLAAVSAWANLKAIS